jgi:O-antigen ligase
LTDRLEAGGFVALMGVGAALHFSIAAAQSLLAISIACGGALLVTRRERLEAPRFFIPLVALSALTLVSALFSPQPATSLVDTKQLLLFLLVPVAYRFAWGTRGSTLLTVTVSAAAVSAAYGIFQYGLLDYNHLGMRPRGTLGHYMTYSGLLVLVISVALAHVLFGKRDRLWAALVIPALAAAVAVSFTRSAIAGAFAAAALLFVLKDFRLLVLLPVGAVLFLAFAPPALSDRVASAFDLNNPTVKDRIAMMRQGQRMVRARPLIGVGPNMVKERYAEFRDPEAIEPVNPHLHNVPLQIAAERGLPALAVWIWFVGVAVLDLARVFRSGTHRMLAATGLAAMVAMLAAGMFEYNFGDSEFLMLLLLIITLPFAAARTAPDPHR